MSSRERKKTFWSMREPQKSCIMVTKLCLRLWAGNVLTVVKGNCFHVISVVMVTFLSELL